ncbi:DMPK isoform 2 [Pongo abelii]|uniref:DMPK isoform 2 n=1 Tax=Pongo abelii TaxID=9601 RepID=A0A2J8U6P2_PONAB|nr:DMPK isoform 2 [Pongo abelii]
MSAEVRLRRLQQLMLDPGFLGLEPLLDLLLGVHQELGASELAQDKYVADFLQWAPNPGFPKVWFKNHLHLNLERSPSW